MHLMSSRHTAGKAKVMATVMGVGAMVAMGVVTVGHAGEEPGLRATGPSSWSMAPVTKSTAPTELATPFASPTHIAIPCAPRATMPC